VNHLVNTIITYSVILHVDYVEILHVIIRELIPGICITVVSCVTIGGWVVKLIMDKTKVDNIHSEILRYKRFFIKDDHICKYCYNSSCYRNYDYSNITNQDWYVMCNGLVRIDYV